MCAHRATARLLGVHGAPPGQRQHLLLQRRNRGDLEWQAGVRDSMPHALSQRHQRHHGRIGAFKGGGIKQQGFRFRFRFRFRCSGSGSGSGRFRWVESGFGRGGLRSRITRYFYRTLTPRAGSGSGPGDTAARHLSAFPIPIPRAAWAPPRRAQGRAGRRAHVCVGRRRRCVEPSERRTIQRTLFYKHALHHTSRGASPYHPRTRDGTLAASSERRSRPRCR